MIANECASLRPSRRFRKTPCYALIGKDAARLSYLAEVELGDKVAAQLLAGLPVRAEFVSGEGEKR